MRKILCILAFLGVVPLAKADQYPESLDVTSGYIQLIGTSLNSNYLNGNGFTAVGGVSFAGVGCYPSNPIYPGDPVTGCDFRFPTSYNASFDVTQNGVTTSYFSAVPDFITTGPYWQPFVFYGNPSQVTFSESAFFPDIVACKPIPPFPAGDCPISAQNQGIFTFAASQVTVTLDRQEDGSYNITNEAFTFSLPEPSSLLLLGSGLLGLAGAFRRKNLG